MFYTLCRLHIHHVQPPKSSSHSSQFRESLPCHSPPTLLLVLLLYVAIGYLLGVLICCAYRCLILFHLFFLTFYTFEDYVAASLIPLVILIPSILALISFQLFGSFVIRSTHSSWRNLPFLLLHSSSLCYHIAYVFLSLPPFLLSARRHYRFRLS